MIAGLRARHCEPTGGAKARPMARFREAILIPFKLRIGRKPSILSGIGP
ncbi:hypothetical protein [Bradyrhizobium elkanii]|jgi:hypothetical protein|nr:hypothetical protein [Bradyrhizobium elkanii]